MTLQERILAVAMPEPNSGCWLWTHRLTKDGYGHLRVGTAMKLAHRVSYTAFVGSIPLGLEIDHLCRNRACVNPSHLEPVTHQVNVLRGIGRAALNARQTACPRGHPFDEGNTRRTAGHRYCRACNREAVRLYSARKKAGL